MITQPAVRVFLLLFEIIIFYLLTDSAEYNIILKQLGSLIGIKKTHFTFNLSVLIKAMKEGD